MKLPSCLHEIMIEFLLLFPRYVLMLDEIRDKLIKSFNTCINIYLKKYVRIKLGVYSM